MEDMIYDILIIGGGPAGYTAALYGARAGCSVLLIERMAPGGQMGETLQIDNYPGFEDGIDGYTLAEKMKKQGEKFGVKTKIADIDRVELIPEIKTVYLKNGKTVLCRTVIIATGAGPRLLGVAGEAEYTGRGVGYCATCDGMFYRGADVCVVGGGNSAVGDALYLSKIAKSVTLIHRRNELRATRIYEKPLAEAENLTMLLEHKVVEIKGDEKLTSVVAENIKTGERKELFPKGIFISIGRIPRTELFAGSDKARLSLDENGYILADESTKTDIAGVFAAGDVRKKPLYQIVTAVSDGAVAAEAAAEYLRGL